jgi:hypothetical protein
MRLLRRPQAKFLSDSILADCIDYDEFLTGVGVSVRLPPPSLQCCVPPCHRPSLQWCMPAVKARLRCKN